MKEAEIAAALALVLEVENANSRGLYHPDEKAARFARALLSLSQERSAARDAVIEACIRTVCESAWKHEGEDAYSQGMDRGAREQVASSVEALRALKSLGQTEPGT